MTDRPSKKSRAAFVIGGSGGLGSAICQHIIDDWDRLYFSYHRNQQAAVDLQQQLGGAEKAAFYQLDITDSDSIQRAFNSALDSGVEIGAVIFASGAHIDQPYVSQIQQDQWQHVIEVELLGFTRLVQVVLPIFRAQKHGNLVSVVSFAPYHFPPGDALSAVPKAGIEVLCRAIAKEEGRYGIRANSVAPGIINAGLGEEFQKTLFNEQVWSDQRKRVPLKRFGEGGEIAEAVKFFASDRSSYITGQTLIVDGGLSL